MDTLKTNSSVRLQINDGPEVLEFDPGNVLFVEKFYRLLQDFEQLHTEYAQKNDALVAKAGPAKNDLPETIGEQIALAKSFAIALRGEIDALFGENTSQRVFGDSLSIPAIVQFFEGIAPYFGKGRAEKISKYTNPLHEKRNLHRKGN